MLVVKRGIALRLRFELIKEVTDQLREGKFILQVNDLAIAHVLFLLLHASASLAEFFDITSKFSRCNDYG